MQWVAHYSDGSFLAQYNGDQPENRYADIDRARLVSFALYSGGFKILELHFEPGQRLIYRRRVAIDVGGNQTVVYLVGWQQTIARRNVQSIAYLFEDGHIELAGKWRENHPWFDSVEYLEFEKNG